LDGCYLQRAAKDLTEIKFAATQFARQHIQIDILPNVFHKKALGFPNERVLSFHVPSPSTVLEHTQQQSFQRQNKENSNVIIRFNE
jgi:hypothetical protein